jgi:hypothetical protein
VLGCVHTELALQSADVSVTDDEDQPSPTVNLGRLRLGMDRHHPCAVTGVLVVFHAGVLVVFHAGVLAPTGRGLTSVATVLATRRGGFATSVTRMAGMYVSPALGSHGQGTHFGVVLVVHLR